MGFEAILNLIIMIITVIMQIVSGGKPPVNPTPQPVFPTYAQAQCADAQWTDDTNAGGGEVAGVMSKDCTLKFNSVPVSSSTIVDRMTRTVEDQVGANSQQINEVYDMSSNTQKSYASTYNVSADGEDVQVGGSTWVTSNLASSLKSHFLAQSLPTSGDASHLKALETQTEVTANDTGDAYHVRFMTYMKVSRPWLAPARKFRSMLIDGQKAQMQQAAMQALADLANGI